jgi:hypothetical protein
MPWRSKLLPIAKLLGSGRQVVDAGIGEGAWDSFAPHWCRLDGDVAEVERAMAPLDQMDLALFRRLEDGVGDPGQRAPVGLREPGRR